MIRKMMMFAVASAATLMMGASAQPTTACAAGNCPQEYCDCTAQCQQTYEFGTPEYHQCMQGCEIPGVPICLCPN